MWGKRKKERCKERERERGEERKRGGRKGINQCPWVRVKLGLVVWNDRWSFANLATVTTPPDETFLSPLAMPWIMRN
jgi:hypothetical protein